MTIKDIARESGYAVGTVSRVLNNHPDVSEKARERILAVVAKNGYTQNANAKNLKQSVNRSLLVLVKGVRNELFAALVEQLQGLVNNTPYTLLVDYFDEDTDEVQRAIALCAEKKPQGILFLGGNADNFKRSFGRITLPAVLVTSPAEGLDYPNLSSVTTDDFEASVQAVRVLLEYGHRHIAIIGGASAMFPASALPGDGRPLSKADCRPKIWWSMARRASAMKRATRLCTMYWRSTRRSPLPMP